MALKLARTTASGILMENAYHRIIAFVGGASHDDMTVNVAVYLDQAAREAGKSWVEMDVRILVMDEAAEGNVFTDLYSKLKTLPEYAGAVDV